MFVSIEGIDGTGKSTIAKLLAERADFIKVPKLPRNDEVIFKKAKENNASESTLHFLNLSGSALQSQFIQTHLNNRSDIVVSRWIASQIASHHLHSYLKSESPLKIDYAYLKIIQPDLSFLLSADDIIRKVRMQDRGEITENDLQSLLPEAQTLFNKTVKEFYPNLVEINTSAISPVDVVSIIETNIHAYKAKNGIHL